MTSQETEKIKLMNLYEGMTADEWAVAKEEDRLEAHPERDKIKAIQALIAKERNARENEMGEVAGPTNTDGTPKPNAEMTDDEREDFYNDLDSVDEGSQSELNQELLNFGSQSEVDQYMDSLRQSGDGFDNIDDYIEDFKNYVADKGLDEGVKWMKRIAGVK